jgi:MFS family permease
VTDAFLLAIATGLVTGGKLGDHYGRRRLFSLGAAGFALTSAGCGLSVSMAMLIGFRAAQGLAGAAPIPGHRTTRSASWPPRPSWRACGPSGWPEPPRP